MIEQDKNIENLFRNAFQDYKVEPSDKVWNNIDKSLRFYRFFKFSFTHFNVYFLAAIVSVSAFTGWYYFAGKNKPAIQEINTIISDNNIFTKELPVVMETPDMADNFEDRNTEEVVQINPDRIKNNSYVNSTAENTQVNNTGKYDDNQNIIENTKTYRLPDLLTNAGLPVARYAIYANKGCAPFTVIFQNKSKNADFYEWNFGDGYTSVEKNPVHVFEKPGRYIIALRSRSKSNMSNNITDTIWVHDNPVACIQITAQSIFAGEPIQFGCNGKENYKYEWSFGDNNKSAEKSPLHIYKNEGNYNVKLKIKNNNDCTDSAVMENITVRKSGNYIEFPNAFTPNITGSNYGYYTPGNDLQNEVFYPVVHSVINEYHLTIFDRKGLLLFETTDINRGWDGYYKNTLVPVGVYVYEVTGKFANGKYFSKKGDITVIYQKQQ